MKQCLLAIFTLGLNFFTEAAEVASGPMPGYSSAREVTIWLQTDAPSMVQIAYWPTENPRTRRLTSGQSSKALNAYTVELNAKDLQPGTRYAYQVLLDGEPVTAQYTQHFKTQPLWQRRIDPPDFSFALASCSYVNQAVYDRPGDPFGGDYQIYSSVADQQPDFMLWLGDNVYYREVDWNAPSSMYARYSYSRRLPELQRLLTSTHHYATWDDHDYGPNDSDRSYFLREQAVQVFNDFWPNPPTNVTGAGGITSYFQWHDVDFFLLDNRYFRQANYRTTGQRTLLGKAQLQWLIDALKNSDASFKFVVMGGQFVASAEVFETYANLAPGERRQILDLLAAEAIPGVIFLSGDRHHAALHKMDRSGLYPLYDWTVSPITAKAYSPITGEGQYRVDGSVYAERNFGIAKVTGPLNDRTLKLMLHDTEGQQVWSTQILQRNLR